MNKTELIDKIAAGAEITKAQAKAALDATTNALKDPENGNVRFLLHKDARDWALASVFPDSSCPVRQNSKK